MRRLSAAAVLALALALGPGATAHAREVAGVNLGDTAALAGKTLQLNGAGLRSKLFIKVYVGALYLEQKSSDPAAILAADQAWLVSMTFKRDVEKEKIIGAFKEGFENNSKAGLPGLLEGLARFDGVLKDLKSGDVMVITYVPGQGSTLVAPGGGAVTVEGKPFADALLRNWLGDKPADGDLKKGMLGK
jgi:hypothetical protein